MADLKENPDKEIGCCVSVHSQGSWGSYPCARKGKYLGDDGKPYCKQHHPITKKARDDKWREKYDRDWAQSKHTWAVRGHDREAVSVLQKIADGDNDARATAQEFIDERNRLSSLPIEHYMKERK